MSSNTEKKNVLNEIVSFLFRAPHAKRHRALFLHEQFQGKSSEELSRIVNLGPIAAGISKEELSRRAKKLVEDISLLSASGSFVLGLVDRIAKFLTVPVDLVQYFVFMLRMAQELSYLYGEEDWWLENRIPRQSAVNMAMVYVGAMAGISKAEEAITQRIAQKLQDARNGQTGSTQNLDIAGAETAGELSSKLLISALIKGFASSVPVVGGVISGGYTAVTLIPMGKKLDALLSKAAFGENAQESPQVKSPEQPTFNPQDAPPVDPHENQG
ncbi:MAG: hypothetical protein ACOX6G_09695 [Christensenellales bacterium]|jgi:hypothetical protein|nr:hypothetical protein [Clostridiales bacterium]